MEPEGVAGCFAVEGGAVSEEGSLLEGLVWVIEGEVGEGVKNGGELEVGEGCVGVVHGACVDLLVGCGGG